MKKIGLLSDTHDYWDEAFETYFENCDEIWHAGDIGSMEIAQKFESIKPFRAVYGNIDDYRVLRFTEENIEVVIKHIGGYPNRYDPSIRNELITNPPKLFISGHSHILKVMYDDKLKCLHMNPGSAGIYGIHKVRTLLRFVIDDGNIRDLEVIEMAKRW